MASIKVKFRPSAVADREGAVYYQIIHERKVRILPTSYRIFDSEWDNEHSTLSRTDKNAGRTDHLLAIRSAIRSDIERLASICRKLDVDCLCFTADDIVAEFNRMKTDNSLFNFMKKLIAGLKKRGNIRTSETYRSTLNSFASFRNYEDIMLDSISCSTMESYELWLRNRGLTPNTTSFYMRILRAVYNRAVENDMTENRSPFRHVYTGIEKTVKRALPLRTVRKIKELDLSQNPLLDFARNMFMMSFYLRGMSFIDMAFLKKSDLKNGYLTYRRRKTGQRLIIKWTAEMQAILEKYPENKSDYLLPIIKAPDTNERSVYRNVGYSINQRLKAIARMLGINIPLTMYVARHSWASAAKAKGIPVSVISEGMGHDSEATTQIYLASLDASVVDSANSIILNSLKPNKSK